MTVLFALNAATKHTPFNKSFSHKFSIFIWPIKNSVLEQSMCHIGCELGEKLNPHVLAQFVVCSVFIEPSSAVLFDKYRGQEAFRGWFVPLFPTAGV